MSVFLWVIIICAIILTAAYLIVIANGYKINYHNWRIVKTGMIVIKSEPKDVKIFVNNKEVANKTPFTYAEIFPGQYDVKISKDGYRDWVYSFNIEPSLVSMDNNVKLFLSNPIKLEASDIESANLDKLVQEWPAKGLEIKNSDEIWFQDVLITRFSEPIKKISWYPDLKHIIFQIGKEIRIMDADGTNNIKLIDLSSDSESSFITLDSGKILLYRDSDIVRKIKIQ